MVFGLVLLVFGFIVRLKSSGCGFWFYFVFCLILFLSQVVVVGLAVVKIFRLWLSVLLWLKFSGYGLVSSALSGGVGLCQAVVFGLVFYIFGLAFRLYQAIVCGLVSSVLLCCCMLLCQAVVFVLVLFPFNFWVWLCCG